MSDTRKPLRLTFDSAADLYDAARPSYPTELLDDLVDLAELKPGDRKTFSGHISMEAVKREHLYQEIRRRIGQRPDRRVRRHWYAILHVARRSARAPVSEKGPGSPGV